MEHPAGIKGGASYINRKGVKRVVSGTLAGGLKAAKTNMEIHGKDFYRNIGRKGGRNGHKGGFAANPALARLAGAKGGRKSMRGKAYSIDKPDISDQCYDRLRWFLEFVEEVFRDAGLTDRSRSGKRQDLLDTGLNYQSYKRYYMGLTQTFKKEEDRIDAENLLMGCIYKVRRAKGSSPFIKDWIDITNAFVFAGKLPYSFTEGKWQYNNYSKFIDPVWDESIAAAKD